MSRIRISTRQHLRRKRRLTRERKKKERNVRRDILNQACISIIELHSDRKKFEEKNYSPTIASFVGTLISAFAVFCCGKHDYEKNIVAFLYNLLAAILQSATIFLLVGWIWSVRWGILFIQLSGKNSIRSQ